MSELTPEEVEALMGTTVKNVSSMPNEGVAEYEIVEPRFFEPGDWDNDDVYKVISIVMRNCDDESANPAAMKVRLYADKDPKTNDWVRDKKGNVIVRGLEKASPNSNYGKLLAAVWPNEKDRIGKGLRDLVGQRLKANIAHKVSPNGKDYAEVNPRPL